MYTKVDHPERCCLNCDISFKPKRSDKMFCNPTCRKLYGKKHLGHSKGNRKLINRRQHIRKNPYIEHKKGVCCSCGFIPEHACQLDVDHIDGNHENNNISNLQTLCANCHRLKTAKQLGWI